jgi:PPOX class probable F420-dependent enzyme
MVVGLLGKENNRMLAMSQTQVETFLQEARHAIVGTIRADGSIQMSSVWYVYESGYVYISITRETAKYQNLRRDPRITICVDGGRSDVRTVVIYGTATLIEKGDPLEAQIKWQIIRHYHDTEEKAHQYAKSTHDLNSVLIKVDPQNIISQDFN